MIVEGVYTHVQMGNITRPLPEVVRAYYQMTFLVEVRRVMVGHWKTMEMSVREGIWYSFEWSCSETGRVVQWIPRVTQLPSEEVIHCLRTIPGFLLGDIIRALIDDNVDFQSDDKVMSIDVEPFGFLEIR